MKPADVSEEVLNVATKRGDENIVQRLSYEEDIFCKEYKMSQIMLSNRQI